MSRQSIDLYAHSNPAFVASVTHWTCDGFAQERAKRSALEDTGILIVWALSALVLLSTDEIRSRLPKTSAKKLTNLFHENPSWRPALYSGVSAWTEAFWRGVGLGSAKGILVLKSGRLYSAGKIGLPSDEWTKTLRQRAQTFGKIMATESDDVILASAFGLNTSRGPA